MANIEIRPLTGIGRRGQEVDTGLDELFWINEAHPSGFSFGLVERTKGADLILIDTSVPESIVAAAKKAIDRRDGVSAGTGSTKRKVVAPPEIQDDEEK